MALRFLTAGESHGPALLGILEGLPAGFRFRRPISRRSCLAQNRPRSISVQKIEGDEVEIGWRASRPHAGSPLGL